MLECCKTGNKITVYDIDHDSNMDKAILSALLTGKVKIRLKSKLDIFSVNHSNFFVSFLCGWFHGFIVFVVLLFMKRICDIKLKQEVTALFCSRNC